MFIYKVNMYLGLSGALAEIKYARLYSTTYIESEVEMTDEEVVKEYFKSIETYPKTHHLEIVKYVKW